MMQPQTLLLPPVYLSSAGFNYSSTFLQFGLGLQKVHKIWQFYMRSKMRVNSDHWLSLLLGHSFDHFFGHRTVTKIITVPFFVTVRLLNLIEQEDAFLRSFGRLKLAFQGMQPVSQCPNKVSGFKYLFSEYRYTQYRQNISTFTQRVQRIAYSIFDFLKHFFFLVMRFMDILELFSSDQAKIEELMHRSVQEGIVNLERVADVICNNNQNFLLRIEQLEKIMNEKSSFAFNPIRLAITFLNTLDQSAKTYKKTAVLTGNTTRIILKKTLLEMLPADAKKFIEPPILEKPCTNEQGQLPEYFVTIPVNFKRRQPFDDFCFP